MAHSYDLDAPSPGMSTVFDRLLTYWTTHSFRVLRDERPHTHGIKWETLMAPSTWAWTQIRTATRPSALRPRASGPPLPRHRPVDLPPAHGERTPQAVVIVLEHSQAKPELRSRSSAAGSNLSDQLSEKSRRAIERS